VVPALEGKGESAARTVLQDMGFVVHVTEKKVSDPKLDGVVLATVPKAGTKVARGSTVTMIVGVKT
jgi:beta-lactam-binding protein with PASTA domain